MTLTKKFFCPVNGWDCPYWKKDGSCSMVNEGLDPVKECDDAGYFWGDDDYEWCDYFVWEDENGIRYDEQELLDTKLNVPDIYVVGGTDKLMDIRTHRTKTLEEIESYFWDAFLQGFDDWCGQSIDTAWLNYLREYQTCLREFINGTE